nr:MAG: putative RNA-dependent RNA polymerase [Mitoviridae sp.]
MISEVKTKDRVCQHLKSLNIPSKEAARVASLLCKWLVNSGPEWTVERLKDLKASHQESLQSGQRYTPPIGWATRKNRDGEYILKDGFYHRLLTHTRFNLKQVEGVLRIYQVIELDGPSRKQLHKMEKAITASSLAEDTAVKELSGNLKPRGGAGIGRYTMAVGSRSKTLPELLGSSKKGSPTFNISYKGEITYARSCKRDRAESADWLEFFQTDRSWNSFWKKYPADVSKAFGTSDLLVSYAADQSDSNLIGSVVILQSPGAKARWIANPFLPIQALGEPLKDRLLAYSKLYPEIKTLDQDAGHQVVVDWLKSGKCVYSFDATAFTDRFPVALQLEMARKLHHKGVITESDLEALEIVTRGSWWSVDLKRSIKWEVGQPLGYGPSFHLATLAHAMILDHLDQLSNGGPTQCWQVVGDDVVIADATVAKLYEEKMKLLGVEINLSKSLISSKYAEFLGKLITSEGVNPSMKVKILSGHSQIIDALAFYGWNGWKHLSTKQKFLAMDVFLPEHLGGLGWRIPGQSYKRFLSSVNLEKIRDRTVRKEVREIFGTPEEPHSLQKLAELRSEYYSRNSLPISLSEWERVDDGVKAINESKDIPISESTGAEASEGLKSINSFSYLIDTIVRLENHTSKRLFTEDGRVNYSNPATAILNKLGYVNTSEKERSSQSDSLKEFNYEQRKSKPSSGIFSRDFQQEAIDQWKNEQRAKLRERIQAIRKEEAGSSEEQETKVQPKRPKP